MNIFYYGKGNEAYINLLITKADEALAEAIDDMLIDKIRETALNEESAFKVLECAEAAGSFHNAMNVCYEEWHSEDGAVVVDRYEEEHNV